MSNANTYLQTILDATADVITLLQSSKDKTDTAVSQSGAAHTNTRDALGVTNDAGNNMDNVLNAIYALRQAIDTETPQVLFGIADSVVNYVIETLDTYRAVADKLEEAQTVLRSAYDTIDGALQQAHRLDEETRDYQSRVQ